jgi:hypothetical protein
MPIALKYGLIALILCVAGLASAAVFLKVLALLTSIHN